MNLKLTSYMVVLGLVLGLCAQASELPMRPTQDVWIGHQRALVILLEWPNRPAQVSREEVERVFFGMNPGDHSMRQFLLENSGGKYDLTGTVLPWRKAKHKWGRLWCMFQEKLADIFDRTHGCSPKTIMREAWSVVKDDIDISDYDTDHNGKIDHLFVVHSGRLWKPRGTPDDVFYTGSMTDEGAVFQSQGMGKLGDKIPIGFFLHESGHNNFLLGDFYGDGPGYTHGSYGEAMWGIMGLGAWGMSSSMPVSDLFRYPAPYEAASKVRIGWAQAQVFTQTMRHVRLRPIETSADVAVVPMGANDEQGDSFFLEYRSDHGLSHALPGHGLLIWQGWRLIQADGRDDLNHGHNLRHRPLPPNQENFGDASDPFPGSMGVTSYRDPRSGLVFENISQTDEAVDLDIVFPNANVERESEGAIRWALRTMSKSFWPVSLNGHAFDYDLYPHSRGEGSSFKTQKASHRRPRWMDREDLVH